MTEQHGRTHGAVSLQTLRRPTRADCTFPSSTSSRYARGMMLRTLTAAGLSGLFLLAGCNADGSASASDDETAAKASAREPGINLRVGVPPSATEVSRGTGKVEYTPSESGTVVLYDLTTNQTVGQYYVRPGQTLAVDGASGRAVVSGNEVRVNETLSTTRTYIVYFQEDASAADSSSDRPNGARFRIVPDEMGDDAR